MDMILQVPQALVNIITAAPTLDDELVAIRSGLHSVLRLEDDEMKVPLQSYPHNINLLTHR